MDNIQFRIELFNGEEIGINVKSENIFDAAEEIRQSIAAGDIRVDGIPIQQEDVHIIEDVAG